MASGDTDPVYLLQGEDDVEKAALASQFVSLVDEGLAAFNVERVHAGDWTTGDRLAAGVASLSAAVRTLPMMSPRRVVIVSQAESLLAPKRESEAAERAIEEFATLLERPETMTALVLVTAALDKRTKIYKTLVKHATIVDCGSPEDVAGAARWVKTRLEAAGMEIDPAGARVLATLAGFPERPQNNGRTGDVKRLRGEVDRLMLYALGQKKITMDDVREVAGPAALQDDWAMANAIEDGRAAEALRQLALMFEGGEAPEKILGQLGYVVRAKFPYAAPQSLSGAVESLFRTDQDLKRSGGDARVLLERLVVELCEGKRSRRVGRPF
ncbi:MAG TPA: DNA polymerase III subunit delta [Vicinamibacterales bacterium]|nr:DNA polymerase III subunit delta [Vicinamibacterales bacterium]